MSDELVPDMPSTADLDRYVSGDGNTRGQRKGRSKVGKSADPDYHKLTLYLPKTLILQIKGAVGAIPDKDISDLAAELFREFLDQQK